jgi:uncharacterized protein (TIGR02996 family)
MSSRDARDIPNPADHPDAVPFLRSIAASGGDPLSRLVFSDWLEEHGYHNAAAGQRWAAANNKRPEHPNLSLGGWYTPSRSGFPDRVNIDDHILPHVYHDALHPTGNVLGALHLSIRDPQERVTHFERLFLDAAHRVPHDEDNNPVSQYRPDQLGYQSDT